MSRSFAILALITFGLCAYSESSADGMDRRARILRVYRLHPPYEIMKWSTYADGGSISGQVKDGRRNTLLFSIASHMRPIPLVAKERMRTVMDSIEAIPTDLYIGHYQNKNSDAEKLEVGSLREKALLDLLELAALDELGSQRIAQLDSIWNASDDVGRKISSVDALPMEEKTPYMAYLTAVGLRKHRQEHVAGWDD